MNSQALAKRLLRHAITQQQSAHRLSSEDDVAAIRREVRRLARKEGVKVRTGLVDDTVVVILADADLWVQSAATMREKLRPTI